MSKGRSYSGVYKAAIIFSLCLTCITHALPKAELPALKIPTIDLANFDKVRDNASFKEIPTFTNRQIQQLEFYSGMVQAFRAGTQGSFFPPRQFIEDPEFPLKVMQFVNTSKSNVSELGLSLPAVIPMVVLTQAAGAWSYYEVGTFARNTKKPYSGTTPTIPLSLDPGEEVLAVLMDRNAAIPETTGLFPLDELAERDNEGLYLLVLFCGFMLSVVAYNLYLGVASDRAYLFYVGFLVFSYLCLFLLIKGFLGMWFGSLDRIILWICMGMGIFIGAFFISSVLDLNRLAPKLNKAMIASASVYGILSVVNVTTIFMTGEYNSFLVKNLSPSLGVIIASLFIVVSIYEVGFRQGHKIGKIFAIAWLPLIISAIGASLELSFIGPGLFLKYGTMVGMMFEGVTLSLVLIYRDEMLKTVSRKQSNLVLEMAQTTKGQMEYHAVIDIVWENLLKELPLINRFDVYRTLYQNPENAFAKGSESIKLNTQERRPLEAKDYLPIDAADLKTPLIDDVFAEIGGDLYLFFVRQSKYYGYLQIVGASLKSFKVDEKGFLKSLCVTAAVAMESGDMAKYELEKTKMASDLEVAKLLQENLIKKGESLSNFDIAYFYKSAEQTGGDWLAHYHDKTHEYVYVCCGDVTGHGVGSALVTGVVHGSISTCISNNIDRRSSLERYDPAEVILEVLKYSNQVIGQSTGSEGKIMTLALLALDLKTGHVWHANAGHSPLVHLNSVGPTLKTLPGVRLGYKQNAKWSIKEFNIASNDSLILYTDGLVENSGPSGKALSEKDLKRILTPLHTLDSQSIKKSIEDSAKDLWQNTPPQDDCAFLVCRWQNSQADH